MTGNTAEYEHKWVSREEDLIDWQGWANDEEARTRSLIRLRDFCCLFNIFFMKSWCDCCNDTYLCVCWTPKDLRLHLCIWTSKGILSILHSLKPSAKPGSYEHMAYPLRSDEGFGKEIPSLRDMQPTKPRQSSKRVPSFVDAFWPFQSPICVLRDEPIFRRHMMYSPRWEVEASTEQAATWSFRLGQASASFGCSSRTLNASLTLNGGFLALTAFDLKPEKTGLLSSFSFFHLFGSDRLLPEEVIKTQACSYFACNFPCLSRSLAKHWSAYFPPHKPPTPPLEARHGQENEQLLRWWCGKAIRLIRPGRWNRIAVHLHLHPLMQGCWDDLQAKETGISILDINFKVYMTCLIRLIVKLIRSLTRPCRLDIGGKEKIISDKQPRLRFEVPMSKVL